MKLVYEDIVPLEEHSIHFRVDLFNKPEDFSEDCLDFDMHTTLESAMERAMILERTGMFACVTRCSFTRVEHLLYKTEKDKETIAAQREEIRKLKEHCLILQHKEKK